jgi:hypothetical protein
MTANATCSSTPVLARARIERIRRSSCLPVPWPIRSRRTTGAVAFNAWSWLSTRVRSLTAERRAISNARIAVRIPRPRGVETLSSARTRLAAAIASMRSDFPARRSRRRGRSTSNTECRAWMRCSQSPAPQLPAPSIPNVRSRPAASSSAQSCSSRYPDAVAVNTSSASICPRWSSAPRRSGCPCGCRPRRRSSPSPHRRRCLVMWRPSDRAVLSDVQASMKSRRHPWTTAGDRSLRGHRSASRLVSHPAAAHTLQGVSDAAPGSHVASPYGLRSAAAGSPNLNQARRAVSNYTAG